MKREERPLLIVRLGAMGDILHALPAVALLRRALPETSIGWVVERRWRELLCAEGAALCGSRNAARPLLDAVHLVDTKRWRKNLFSWQTRREFVASLGELRAVGYQTALDFQGAMKSAIVARLAHASTVVGFRHPRESLARLFYTATVAAHGRHVVEQNMELAQRWLQRIGQERATATLAPGLALLPHDAAAEHRIEEFLRGRELAQTPLAILNPGAGWAAKQWPVARYGELAKRLAEQGVRSVINYGPGEEALAERVVEVGGGKAVALCTSLGELIALSRRARLFVGGDTGPMHLAALLGVRTIALFGPTDPGRNGPFWAGSRVLRDAASVTSYSHRRLQDAGLERLSVQDVLAEALAVLDPLPSKKR